VKRLVVTADDFGLSPEVNEAVCRAHRDGILTCASLMAGAPAAREAIALARTEAVPVGVHLTLVSGRPVLPPERIPDLVDRHGRFRPGLVRPGARLFLSPRARRQASAECEAQVRAVLDAGLDVDHLNGHQHFHLHPAVLDIAVGIARRHRIPAVRLPWQPGPPPVALAPVFAIMAPWTAWARRRLRRAGITTSDALFGLWETGAMTEAEWLRIVPRLSDGLTEVYCHPATASRGVLQAEMPRYRHADELAALLSPAVRGALERAGVQRVTFSAAAAGAGAAGGPRAGG
jgi:chitin disaccharide deacetylase